MSTSRRLVVVAFDRFQLLDLAGPVEVFDVASRLALGARVVAPEDPARPYRSVLTSLDGGPVTATSGVTTLVNRPLGAVLDDGEPIDTLLVIGGDGTRAALADEALLALVRRGADRAGRTASVCSGALVLAAAGLLDGRRATTHWSVCDLLAGLGRDVTVEADRLHVRDGDVWTSAGVTAGIDLALALVEHDLGPELAHRVAGHLVVFARRPGGQAQFSAQLRAQAARSPGIREVQRWLPDHLAEDLAVDRLAARAAMSPRTFARAFRDETGTTPAAHVEELRVEAARRLLETSDLTVAAVAARCGFAHAETLHRAFVRRVGTTPARYRQHFART